MKNKTIDTIFKVLFFTTIFAVIFVVICGFFASNKYKEYNSYQKCSDLNENWTYTLNGETKSLDLPGKIECKYGSVVELYNIIPNDFIDGDIIYLSTDYSSVKAYIDNEEIEVIGISDTDMYENPTVILNVPNNSQGKNLKLEVTSNGGKFRLELYSAYYGLKDEVRFSIIDMKIPVICIAMTMAVLAILFIIYGIVMIKANNELSIKYASLGCFIMLSSIWVFTDCGIQGAFFAGSLSHYYANILSFVTIPIPLMIFINRQLENKSNVIRMEIFLSILYTLIVCIGLFTKTIYLAYILVIDHILMSIIIYTVLHVYARKKTNDKFQNILMYIGIGALGLTGVLTIINFYFNVSPDNTYLYKYGILIFTILLSLQLFVTGFELYAANKTKEATYILNEEFKILSNKQQTSMAKYYVDTNKICYTRNGVDYELTPQEFIRKFTNGKSEKEILDFFYDIKQGKSSGNIGFEANIFNQPGYYNASYELVYNNKKELAYALINYSNETRKHEIEKRLNEAEANAKEVVKYGGAFFELNLTKATLIKTENNLFDEYLGEGNLTEFTNYLLEYIVSSSDKSMLEMMLSQDKLYSIYGRDNGQSFEVKAKINDNDAWLRFTIDCYSSIDEKEVIVIVKVESVDSDKKYIVDNMTGIDRITGLLNANSFETQVRVLLEQLDGSKCHTIMTIQIDNFEDIIAKYGSSISNLIIRDLAGKLKSGTRSSDTLARTGIDYFALFIPYTPNKNGSNEELIKRISQELNSTNYDGLEITCSIGVSVYPYDGLSFTNLINASEEALIRAKEKGNGSYVYSSGEMNEFIKQENQSILNKMKPIFNYVNRNKKDIKFIDEDYKTVVVLNKALNNNSEIINTLSKNYLVLNANTIDELKKVMHQEISLASIIVGVKDDEDFDRVSALCTWKNSVPSCSVVPMIAICFDNEYDFDLYNNGASEVINTKDVETRLVKTVQKCTIKRKNDEIQSNNIIKTFIENK